jgi:hypothetical protein
MMTLIEADRRSGTKRARGEARTAQHWTRLWFWMPLLAAGMLAGWLLSHKPRPMGRMGRRAYPSRARRTASRPGQSLSRLRNAIVGSDRQLIAQVFGLPRGVGEPGRVEVNRPAFWDAGTWYYPLRRRERMAMAIRFDQGIAADVQFIPAPGAHTPRSFQSA